MNDVSTSSRPPMLPALSSDISPQDTENDRLRKEIVQSLTPQSSRYEQPPTESPLPHVPAQGQTETAPLHQLRHTGGLSSAAVPTAINQQDRAPMLEQRFSWEPPKTPATVNPGQGEHLPTATTPRTGHVPNEDAGSPGTIRPNPPSSLESANNSSRMIPTMTTADTIRQVPSETHGDRGALGNGLDFQPSANSLPRQSESGLRTAGSTSLLSSTRELPFRDILSLGTPQERIHAYNSNRGLIADTDTGLEEWLRSMGGQLSEHADLIRSNGRLSAQETENLASFKPSPARSKFHRIASLANTHHSTDPEIDGSSTYANSPSGARSNNPQMQGQGKKLLQSAGKIGGQAGVAAKGLFAKGKDKLRAGGSGGDKVAT